jgi:heat shock protein HslJ
MRVQLAIFALLVGVALASAEDFLVIELATYSGKLPCADCVGLQYVLTLRPDGWFYRQRTYLHSENTGQIVSDVGAWTAKASVLTLASTTHESESFAVSSTGSLLQFDRDTAHSACDGQSEQDCTLSREPHAHVPLGAYRIRGIYKESEGQRTLQPCGSAVPIAAETTGRSLLLRRLSDAVAGGKPALITVTAPFETSAKSPNRETLRIASVLTAHPGGVCPAALPVPAIVSDFMPQSPTSAAQPTEFSAMLSASSWVLTEVDHMPPPAGVGPGEASIRFLQEGHVTGYTGCNRFKAPYALTGRSVHFGHLMTTRLACPVSANIEVPYLKVLEDARQIDIQGVELYLLNSEGHRLARFRAVHQP